MLGIQLAALSMPELRRLLEAARARGQDSLVRQLEAELAARPGRMGGVGLLQAAAIATPAPAPAVRRRSGMAVAVASLAAVIGGVLAWGLTLDTPVQVRPQAVALNNAADAPPRIAVALTTAALPEEAPTQLLAEPAAPPAVVETSAAPAAKRSRNPCLDLPTAHQRLVCGYPSLAIEDRRLRAALERAKAGSRDPYAIDSSQAAWLSASANIHDRLELADRYAQRIADLEAQAR